MSNVAKLENNITVLHDFFMNCIGTNDDRQLMDVVITDSFIKQLVYVPEKEGTRTVDHLASKDINFVFSNGTFRTFRVPVTHWDKTLSTLKKMARAGADGYLFDKGEENPMEQLLLTTIPKQFYKQQVVMQDLGLDLPVSLLTTDYSMKGDESFTDGDLAALELKFNHAGKMLAEAFRLVKRNLQVLAVDSTVKRDHILHYANFIDFGNRHVYPSLNRFGYKLAGTDDDFDLLPTKLEPEHWQEIFTSELARLALIRLTTAFNGFNAYVDQHFTEAETDHELRTFAIEHLFSRAWPNVMKTSDLVYSMELSALTHEIDVASEELLKEVVDLSANPGLDLNSLKVYDYTDPNEPTFVKDMSPDLHAKYRQEFVGLMYQKLLTSGHTLLRPYGVKKVITDPAEIAEHQIGEVRTERF